MEVKFGALFQGTYKVRNEIETKRNQRKRNLSNRIHLIGCMHACDMLSVYVILCKYL